MIIYTIEEEEEDFMDFVPDYLLLIDLLDNSVDEIEKQAAEIERIIKGDAQL